jgi:Resolvase, N terminal domain/Recombinase
MAGKPSGALIRVSTKSQDAKLQRASILKQADIDGAEIVKWYELDGKSAYKGQQETALAEALGDAKAGMIRALYCFNTDRVDRRGIRYTLQYRYEIMQTGALLVSTTQPYCIEDTPQAEKQIADDASRAQNESQIKSERQLLLTIPEIHENQGWYGSIPWGFETVGDEKSKRLVPTELGRLYIPQIFQRVIDGESLASICKWLDSLHIRTRKGKEVPWWPTMIMGMIRNPVYSGWCEIRAGGLTWIHEWSNGNCDPLVDGTTQRLAIEALGKSKHRGPSGDPAKRAMLKGAIVCGNPECDATGAPESPMYRIMALLTARKDGPKAPFYRCYGRGANRRGCGTNVRVDLVDATVNKIIANTWRRPVMLPTLVKGTDNAEQLKQVSIELRQLPSRGLSRTDEQTERERLWAIEDELTNATDTDDKWVMTPTGELWADLYAAEPASERGSWLSRHGFRIYAARGSVTVSQRLADGSEVTWTEPLT